MTDITPIIEAVFALLAAIITAVVIPYIKNRTTAQQQAEINAWVRIEEKKAFVLEWLKSHGVTVDMEKLDALIESAVYDMNNGLIAIEEVR